MRFAGNYCTSLGTHLARLCSLCTCASITAVMAMATSAGEDICPDMPGELIRGDAIAVDGGTIALAGKTVILADIAAPRRTELCLAESGTPFECGEIAYTALQRKITELGGIVECLAEVTPSQTHFYGFCGRLGSNNCIQTDIGGEMAAEGMARVLRVREHGTNRLYFEGGGAEQAGKGLFSHITEKRGYFNSAYWLLDNSPQ